MTTPEMMEALQALAAEKGISADVLLEALANGLESAYKRMPEASEEAYVVIDETFDIRVIAQELDDDGNVVREWDDTPEDFGRIAAQTARQVMMQRIREVERDMKYEEYAGREGDIVTGIVQQNDARYTLLDLGRVEALLPQSEQVPYERPETGARLKAYIVEVRKTAKGPQIVVSRTHPGLIKELFKLEVPEIADGTVEIRACAREPGHRTKIAVWSNDHNVDPVGACVGARGARVRQVVNELRGEKIDIVPFSEMPGDLVAKALSPAKVKEVIIDEESGIAETIVPDHQLSLAIGREGQNARLAARLTGWRVDIKSETQLAEEEAAYEGEEWAEGEWVTDADTGEMVWQPADGSAVMRAEDYEQAGADEATAVTETADADEVAPDAEAVPEVAPKTETADADEVAPDAEAVPEVAPKTETADADQVAPDAEAVPEVAPKTETADADQVAPDAEAVPEVAPKTETADADQVAPDAEAVPEVAPKTETADADQVAPDAEAVPEVAPKTETADADQVAPDAEAVPEVAPKTETADADQVAPDAEAVPEVAPKTETADADQVAPDAEAVPEAAPEVAPEVSESADAERAESTESAP